MTLLNGMSIIIAIGNVTAGSLTGPAVVALHRVVSRLRWGHDPSSSYLYAWSRQAQGIGWVALFIAQVTLVGFGFTAGYVGFKFIQSLMIVVAATNFVVWLHEGHVRARRGEI
jgi:hypothetical protein